MTGCLDEDYTVHCNRRRAAQYDILYEQGKSTIVSI